MPRGPGDSPGVWGASSGRSGISRQVSIQKKVRFECNSRRVLIGNYSRHNPDQVSRGSGASFSLPISLSDLRYLTESRV